MLNVQLVKKTNFEGFTMVLETVQEKGVHNVLIITDNVDAQKHWESKNVRVELARSIDDNVMRELRKRYKQVETIFITSPKLIARYFNETVNVKVIKAKELFHDFDSTIYILSDYANTASIVSNSASRDSKSQEQERSIKARTARGITRQR